MTRPNKFEKIESYQAQDAQGIVYGVNVYAELMDVSNAFMGEPEKWVRVGIAHRMTDTRNSVNVNDDGTLEKSATGRKMTRMP